MAPKLSIVAIINRYSYAWKPTTLHTVEGINDATIGSNVWGACSILSKTASMLILRIIQNAMYHSVVLNIRT